jgi:hypothetical protein
MQHAVGSTPDPAHGYCVDDVARALEVDLLHARVLGWHAVEASAHRNLRFLVDAFDDTTGRLRNFRSIDGEWLGGPGSDDSVGRAILALGETIRAAPDPWMFETATDLFCRAIPKAAKLTAVRAHSSVLLGCAAVVTAPAVTDSAEARQTALHRDATAVMRRLATDLHARFLSSAGPGWLWLEPTLTYENALVPRALIVAGQSLGADVMLRIGLQVLDWLIAAQTTPEGEFSPIGNGWWPRNGERSQFDQQPIEATALLLAAHAALEATGNPKYRATMEMAYGWFLGRNDRRRRMADPARGASADGLTAKGVNRNEGAESTLMWLMAAEHIRASRVDATVAPPQRVSNATDPVPGLRSGTGTRARGVTREGTPPLAAATR